MMEQIGHFQDGGAAYARHRPSYPPELAAALAARVSGRRLAVDLGCGTGQFSRLLVPHFDRVLALDPSADQISNAETASGLDFAVGRAEAIGVPAASVDLLTAAQAAHWFDWEHFPAEVRRVLAPGGRLALVTYGVMELDGAVGERVARFYWDEIHRHWPAERRHVETGYADLPFPFAEEPLPAFDIRRDWTFDQLIGYVETWSAAKRARKDGAGAIIDAFSADLARLWGGADQRHGVRWPVRGRLGR
ncbi:MAG: class I SAM-dependent methyltransferase [Rhodospirillales bacterium]